MKLTNRIKLAWDIVLSSQHPDAVKKEINDLKEQLKSLTKEYGDASSSFAEAINLLSDKKRCKIVTSYDVPEFRKTLNIPLSPQLRFVDDRRFRPGQMFPEREEVFDLEEMRCLFRFSRNVKREVEAIAEEYAKKLIEEGFIEVKFMDGSRDRFPDGTAEAKAIVTLKYYK